MRRWMFVWGRLTVLGALLAGCGSSYEQAVEPATGRVLGSVSYAGLPAEYRIYYAPVNGGANDRELIRISSKNPNRRRGQIDAGNELFSVDLAEGLYEVVLWEVAEGRATVRPEEPFSVQFVVEPGRSVYVGRFNFAHQQGIRSRDSSVEVTYSDQLQQDVALFRDSAVSSDLADVRLGIDKGMSLQWSSNTGATDKALSLIVFSSF